MLPVCSSCKGFGDVACVYDKPASIAYVRHLEKKVKELSRYAARSQGNLSSYEGLEQIPLSQSDQDLFEGRNSKSPELYNQDRDLRNPDFEKFLALSATPASSLSESEKVLILSQTSQMSKRYETVALEIALQNNFGYIGLSVAVKCMELYWSWFHPIYLCVYRPSFFRDMATFSPTKPRSQNSSYSPALLSTILSITFPILYGYSDFSKILDQHSHTLLMQEIMYPSNIGTITAVLHRAIKSVQENNKPLIWSFSGLANRLSEDIDLYTDPQKLDQSFTVQDIECRARVAWATFYWDKNFSLYFGRLPSVLRQPFPVAGNILDYSMDSEPWDPVLNNLPFGKHMSDNSFDNKGKGISTANNVIHSLTTASIQVKFGFLANINAFMERVYGAKNTSLIAGKFSIINSPHSTSKSSEYFYQTKVFLKEMTSFWNSTHSDLKVVDYNAFNSRNYVNPSIIANNLIYNSSILIVLLPLSHLDDVLDDHDISMGIESGENIIKLLHLYNSLYGSFNFNHWQEYAPYLAAQYFMSLLKQNAGHPEKDKLISCLQEFLKILRQAHFEFPNIMEIRTDLEKLLSQSQINEMSPFKTSPILLGTQANMHLPIAKQYGQHTPGQSSMNISIPNQPVSFDSSQSNPNDPLLQYKTGYIIPPNQPSMPVLGIPQAGIIRQFGPNIAPHQHPINTFMITAPQNDTGQFHSPQIDLTQIPQAHQRQMNAYTLTRGGVPDMNDISSTGMTNFLGQFSPSSHANIRASNASGAPDSTSQYQLGDPTDLSHNILLGPSNNTANSGNKGMKPQIMSNDPVPTSETREL